MPATNSRRRHGASRNVEARIERAVADSEYRVDTASVLHRYTGK